MANGFAPVQLSYSQNPREAVLGNKAEGFGPESVSSKIARGFVRAGFGVFKANGAAGGAGTNADSLVDPGEVYHVPNVAPAASAAALHSGASSASIQSLTALNGAYGRSELTPARQVTFAFDASTDWDPTTAVLTYVNEHGNTVSENIAVASSATPSTVGLVKRIISLVIPAQTGAGGTFTVGVAALTAGSESLFMGVAIRQALKSSLADGGLFGYPGLLGQTGPADYVDGDTVPCMTMGGIWVASEAPVLDGDSVYIRTAANGNLNVLGSFAPAAGTGLVLLSRARFVRDSSVVVPGTSFYASWARFSYFDR